MGGNEGNVVTQFSSNVPGKDLKTLPAIFFFNLTFL
jgi:hypothetical protein